MDKKIVKTVTERAAGYCEFCGGAAALSMALHHRKLKSRGGKDSVSNLVWVHHGCHNLETESIHMRPAHARDRGFMVPSWREPDEWPLTRPDGSIVLLLNNGTMITPKITEAK